MLEKMKKMIKMILILLVLMNVANAATYDEGKVRRKKEVACEVVTFPGKDPLYMCRFKPDSKGKRHPKYCVHKASYKKLSAGFFNYQKLVPDTVILHDMEIESEPVKKASSSSHYKYIIPSDPSGYLCY